MFPRCQFGQILGLLFLSANQDDPLKETHRPTEVESEVSLRAAPLLTIFTSLKRKQYEFRGSSLRRCLEGQPAEERPTTCAQGPATVVALEPTPRILIPAYFPQGNPGRPWVRYDLQAEDFSFMDRKVWMMECEYRGW